MYTPILWDTCNMLHYIKFKLLYKFRIVVFFFFSKYKYNAYLGDDPKKGARCFMPRILWIL